MPFTAINRFLCGRHTGSVGLQVSSHTALAIYSWGGPHRKAVVQLIDALHGDYCADESANAVCHMPCWMPGYYPTTDRLHIPNTIICLSAVVSVDKSRCNPFQNSAATALVSQLLISMITLDDTNGMVQYGMYKELDSIRQA